MQSITVTSCFTWSPSYTCGCGPGSLFSSKNAPLRTGFLQIQTCSLPTPHATPPATLLVTVLKTSAIILMSLTSRSLLQRLCSLCHPPKGPQVGPQDTHSKQLLQEGLVWLGQHLPQRNQPKANLGAREVYLQM